MIKKCDSCRGRVKYYGLLCGGIISRGVEREYKEKVYFCRLCKSIIPEKNIIEERN